MLHYINNILFKNSNKKSNTSNVLTFRWKNTILYSWIKFITFLVTFISKSIYTKIVQTYSVILQANKISFNMLTSTAKLFLIFFVNVENYGLYYPKLKNYTQLYKLRQKCYKSLHNFWTLVIYKKVNYYNELNINKAHDSEISNFYYNTRIHNTNSRYNTILFYYFNKVVFVKYPYLYWKYINNYLKNTPATNNISQHIRTSLFFMFLQTIFTSNLNSNISFTKIVLTTFKGLSNFFKNIETQVKFQINKTSKKQVYRPTTISYSNRPNSHAYIKTNVKNTYVFNISNIIINSISKFKDKTYKFVNNSLSTSMTNLKLSWYNKVHNTTLNLSNKYLILYLRAARHFNKGRYSRNRQLYRTGVYWCIWLNVVIVYALHYYFYRVVFSFGYLWLPLGVMILSVFSSRLYKYRFYSLNQLAIEFKEYFNFLFFFLLKLQIYLNKCLNASISNFIHFLKYYWTLLLTYAQVLYTNFCSNLFK